MQNGNDRTRDQWRLGSTGALKLLAATGLCAAIFGLTACTGSGRAKVEAPGFSGWYEWYGEPGPEGPVVPCGTATVRGREFEIFCDLQGHPRYARMTGTDDWFLIRAWTPLPRQDGEVQPPLWETPQADGACASLGSNRLMGDPDDILHLPNGNVVLLDFNGTGQDYEMNGGVGHPFDLEFEGTAEALLARHHIEGLAPGTAAEDVPVFFEFDTVRVIASLRSGGRGAVVHGGLPINTNQPALDPFEYHVRAQTFIVESERPGAPAFGFHEFEGVLSLVLSYLRDLGVTEAEGETSGASWSMRIDEDQATFVVDGELFTLPIR